MHLGLCAGPVPVQPGLQWFLISCQTVLLSQLLGVKVHDGGDSTPPDLCSEKCNLSAAFHPTAVHFPPVATNNYHLVVLQQRGNPDSLTGKGLSSPLRV